MTLLLACVAMIAPVLYYTIGFMLLISPMTGPQKAVVMIGLYLAVASGLFLLVRSTDNNVVKRPLVFALLWFPWMCIVTVRLVWIALR
jgi:hypothetical protein